MSVFFSEPLAPAGGHFDTAAMARGEPGLPSVFSWRSRNCTIARVIQRWKQSECEGGRPGGERYLRRHYYRLEMTDGSVWTVYFTRQPTTSSRRAAANRWFLYTIDQPALEIDDRLIQADPGETQARAYPGGTLKPASVRSAAFPSART